MHYWCEHYGREFSRHASLRNHIKTHDSAIDRILHEISEESVQSEQVRDIERNNKEKNQESEEMITITEENNQLESENDMSYDYKDQLESENDMSYDYENQGEELVNVLEGELINTNDEDDQVCLNLY